MIVKNGFTYQFMFKYDGVLFNREWYSVNCSRNTDLDLYKNDSTQFNWLHVCSYSYLTTCLLCLFTAHHVTIYSYNYIITSYLEKYNYGIVDA